jgi:hypothetical protein
MQARNRCLISPVGSAPRTRCPYCCCCGSHCRYCSSFACSRRSWMSSAYLTTSCRWSQGCCTFHCCSCRPEANQKAATYLSCIHFQYTKSWIAETYHVFFLFSWSLQLQRTAGFISHTYICRGKMQLWLYTCCICDFCHPVNCFDTLSICLLIFIKLP